MLLQRKVDRAMKSSRERSLRAEGIDPEEEELLEKGDVKAMILAAMITIFPICLGLILLICLIAYFFMAR